MLVAASLVVFASPATAAQLHNSGGVLSYQAEAGEMNDLRVSSDGSNYVFVDPGAPLILPFDNCTDNTCPMSGVREIRITLQSLNDQLTIDSSVAASAPTPAPRILAEGGSGDDTLTGGELPESLCGGPGTDMLNGGAGNDRLDFPCIDGVTDQTPGADTLNGGPGDDQLNGGPPGSLEADTLSGGDGNDTAYYDQRVAPLTITLDDVATDGEAGEGDDVASDVENVIGGHASDVLAGSAAPNMLDGRDGNDTISGNDGNDTITGANGEDNLDGGAGIDSLWGGGGGDTLAGSAGDDTLNGGAGVDSLDGGDGNDTLNGAEPNLVGADGDDTLSGGAGADALHGGPGNDAMDGGPGADTISGDDGLEDKLTYRARATGVTVTLDGKPNDGERDERDNVASDVEIVIGASLDDNLEGDRGDNTFDGGLGEDFLRGNAGFDTLDAGGASDLIWARDGTRDTVDCGGGGDLVVMDRNDEARNCRWFDRSGSRSPTLAGSALVSGRRFEYRMPVGHRDYDLDGSLRFPSGSRIDATDAKVRVTTATTSKGGRESMSVSGGPFTVRLSRSATAYRFVRGPQRCSRSGPRAPTDARAPQITMQIDKGKRRAAKRRARQRAEVRGKHSVGAAFGTKWITEERCNGTFTRVLSGVVRVRDLERKRTVTLRKGQSYLARAR